MIRAIAVFVAATVLFPLLELAQESSRGTPLPTTGRSVIATRYGIVAASQPLAATAGIQLRLFRAGRKPP